GLLRDGLPGAVQGLLRIVGAVENRVPNIDHRLKPGIRDSDAGINVAHGIGERRYIRELRPRRDGESLIRPHPRIGSGFLSSRELRLQRRKCVVEVEQRLIENRGAKADTVDCHIDRLTTGFATEWSSCSELRT